MREWCKIIFMFMANTKLLTWSNPVYSGHPVCITVTRPSPKGDRYIQVCRLYSAQAPAMRARSSSHNGAKKIPDVISAQRYTGDG